MTTATRKTIVTLAMDLDKAVRFNEFIENTQEMGLQWRNGADMEAEDTDMLDEFGNALTEVLGK